MHLSVAVTALLFTYWLLKKRYRIRPFKLPIDVQTGDVIHGAFGSLLANLSLYGMYVDVAVGVLLYLAYQFAGFLRKNDTVDKDIATFTAGYFSTLILSTVKL
jgi:hypothetical protein